MNKKMIFVGIGLVAGLIAARVWEKKKKPIKSAIKSGIDKFKEDPEVMEAEVVEPNEYGFETCTNDDISELDDSFEVVETFIVHNQDGSKSLADERGRERLYGNYWPYTYAEMLSGLDICDGLSYKSNKFEVVFNIHNMPVEE